MEAERLTDRVPETRLYQVKSKAVFTVFTSRWSESGRKAAHGNRRGRATSRPFRHGVVQAHSEQQGIVEQIGEEEEKA